MTNINRRNFFRVVGAASLAAVSPPGQEKLPASTLELKRVSGVRDPWIEVELDHIAWNFSQLKKRVKVPIMAVVKANAYGHGLIEVSKALCAAGADWLMVGKLQEAVMLRDAGILCPILNFGPFDSSDGRAIVEMNISQSVYAEDVLSLDEAAAKLKKKAPVHIDIDTGMSRTGISYDRALPFLRKIASLSHVKIEGVSSTLTEDPEFDKEQLKRFLEVCSSAKKEGIRLGLRHAASSAGIFSSPDFYLDMVRPGITLYGYYPNAGTQREDPLDLKPALRLQARVIFIKDIAPGDSASYHRSVTATRMMRVAAVGIGYSDGYPPQLGDKGYLAIRGKKFPVLNAVTANHMMVDLGNDREIEVGVSATLLDSDKKSGLTADILAEQSGISSYRILIGLNPLIPRIYTGDGLFES